VKNQLVLLSLLIALVPTISQTTSSPETWYTANVCNIFQDPEQIESPIDPQEEQLIKHAIKAGGMNPNKMSVKRTSYPGGTWFEQSEFTSNKKDTIYISSKAINDARESNNWDLLFTRIVRGTGWILNNSSTNKKRADNILYLSSLALIGATGCYTLYKLDQISDGYYGKEQDWKSLKQIGKWITFIGSTILAGDIAYRQYEQYLSHKADKHVVQHCTVSQIRSIGQDYSKLAIEEGDNNIWPTISRIVFSSHRSNLFRAAYFKKAANEKEKELQAQEAYAKLQAK
jgi:hypothetical protein